MKDKKDILDDLIDRLQNEPLPIIDNEDDFIDSIMDAIPSEESVPQTQKRNWVIVFRTVSGIAAVLIIGLFFFLNYDSDFSVAQINNNYSKIEYKALMPCADANSTPRDLYMCYAKQVQARAERNNFINQFKK